MVVSEIYISTQQNNYKTAISLHMLDEKLGQILQKVRVQMDAVIVQLTNVRHECNIHKLIQNMSTLIYIELEGTG